MKVKKKAPVRSTAKMICKNCGRTIAQIKEGKTYSGKHRDEGLLMLHERRCGKPGTNLGKPSPLRGRKQSPDLVRKRMANRRVTEKSLAASLASLEKARAANIGRKRSEETKKKQSEARIRWLAENPSKLVQGELGSKRTLKHRFKQEEQGKVVIKTKSVRICSPENELPPQMRVTGAPWVRMPHVAFQILGMTREVARIKNELGGARSRLGRLDAILAGIKRRGVSRPEFAGANNPACKPGVGDKISKKKKRNWKEGVYDHIARRGCEDDGRERVLYLFRLPCGRTMFGVALDLRARGFQYEGGCNKAHAPLEGEFRGFDWAYHGLKDAYDIEAEMKGSFPGVDHETTEMDVEETILAVEIILIQRGHDPSKATSYACAADIPTSIKGEARPRRVTSLTPENIVRRTRNG